MKKRHHSYLYLFFGLTIGVIGICFAFLYWMNPYNNLPLREKGSPIQTNNQRFAYPYLASQENYDSVVIGTSAIRLLNPELLNRTFQATFLQLGMNSATSFEQTSILNVFLKHHPNVKYIILGVDLEWCLSAQQYKKLTHRTFPEWMYDDNPWNDLQRILSMDSLEIASKVFDKLYLNLDRKDKYPLNGYSNFLPPLNEYNLKKAQENIQTMSENQRQVEHKSATDVGLTSPPHELFKNLLNEISPETTLLIVFVPHHADFQPKPSTFAQEHLKMCKAKITQLAQTHPKAHILDFMIPSQITTKDSNYWDALHYKTEIADQLVRQIAWGFKNQKSKPGYFNYLK